MFVCVCVCVMSICFPDLSQKNRKVAMEPSVEYRKLMFSATNPEAVKLVLTWESCWENNYSSVTILVSTFRCNKIFCTRTAMRPSSLLYISQEAAITISHRKARILHAKFIVNNFLMLFLNDLPKTLFRKTKDCGYSVQ